MNPVQMDDLHRMHRAAKGTGGITSRDGQKFVVAIFERFPEIYKTAKYLQRTNDQFGTVLTNISRMSAKEAGEIAPGAARQAMTDNQTLRKRQEDRK